MSPFALTLVLVAALMHATWQLRRRLSRALLIAAGVALIALAK